MNGVFSEERLSTWCGDIEAMLGEYRKFLKAAVDGDSNGQSTIQEIK